MRKIVNRRYARPGDLIFYLSGGSTYHVSIYAGNGMQYSATVPGEKIRYQGIWSASIEFRTNWH
jgi:cell wall-associated NlpC family hydrolase